MHENKYSKQETNSNLKKDINIWNIYTINMFHKCICERIKCREKEEKQKRKKRKKRKKRRKRREIGEEKRRKRREKREKRGE